MAPTKRRGQPSSDPRQKPYRLEIAQPREMSQMTSSLSAETNAILKWSQEHLRTYAHVVLDRREVDYDVLMRARPVARGWHAGRRKEPISRAI